MSITLSIPRWKLKKTKLYKTKEGKTRQEKIRKEEEGKINKKNPYQWILTPNRENLSGSFGSQKKKGEKKINERKRKELYEVNVFVKETKLAEIGDYKR